MAKTLKILVLHGYVQTAETVYTNTEPLRTTLAQSGMCSLTYVRGVPAKDPSWGVSRPWWIMARKPTGAFPDGFEDSVRFFADMLSKEQYDGIIGLSQGAAMAALLTILVSNPQLHPDFKLARPHPPFRFAIYCSGFCSSHPGLKDWYKYFPGDVPTVHTISRHDSIVSPEQSLELGSFPKKKLIERHDFGHVIPISAEFTALFADFIGAFAGQAGQDKEDFFARII